MTARELIIASFTSRNRHLRDRAGLGLVLSVWMGWLSEYERPAILIADGEYRITCKTPVHANRLWRDFGGQVDGRVVKGFIKDLTS